MKLQKISVKIEGAAPIMFDKFIDRSKEDRPPEQKMYLTEENFMVIPGINLLSFLISEKHPGAIKVAENRGAGEYIRYCKSHVFINAPYYKITSNGKPIVFKDFKDKRLGIHMESTVVGSGTRAVKEPAKPRPYIKLPWELEFEMDFWENVKIDETKLYNWFIMGSRIVGLGNGRPIWGRFNVVKWNVEDIEIGK